jgi:hypothetical protein
MPGLFPQKPHLRHIINSYNLIEAVAEHDPIGWPKIPILRLAMSVMNEQLQRLALSADRPGLTLQILALAGPHPVSGELSAIFGIEPGREAARHDAVSTGRLANAFPLDGRKRSYLHRTTCLALAMAPFNLGLCLELTPKTTESHWSGGQREP